MSVEKLEKVFLWRTKNAMKYGFHVKCSNLAMKITSGNIADIIGALPVGKYAGYYNSGAAGTPSSYGTFEAVVMNNSTATITAIDTSNGANYIRVKTSNTWKSWERDVTNSDLNGLKCKNVSLGTEALPQYTFCAILIVFRQTSSAKGLYGFDAVSGVSAFSSVTGLSVTCNNKTPNTVNNGATSVHGIYLYI